MAEKILHYEVLQQETGEDIIVSKAWDSSIGRTVIIKEPLPQLLSDFAFVENFIEEGRRLAKIQSPHVGTLYEIIAPKENGSRCYLIFEHVERNLEDLLNSGPIDSKNGRAILIGALTGLRAIHNAGLCHANMRPSSVVISSDGQAKLADLRTVWARTRRGTLELGAGRYSPHESWSHDGRVGAWSDIYALGCVMYELFVGRDGYRDALNIPKDKPVTGTEVNGVFYRAWHRDRSRFATTLHEINPKIDPVISEVIAKMMAKHIDDRFQEADEILKTLESSAPAAKGSQSEKGAEDAEVDNGSKPDEKNDGKIPITDLLKVESNPRWSEQMILAGVVVLGVLIMGLIIVYA